MKTNKLMIASLLILVGIGAITVSCRKEQANYRKAEIITENSLEKTGGDEDPIIRVRVKKKSSFVPVDSAFVETILYTSNVAVNSGYTVRGGTYDRQVAANIYYFRVTVPGNSTPYVTDTVHVSQDVQVNILVD